MSALKTLMNDELHPDLDVELHSYALEKLPPSKSIKKRRYKIDLASQQAECEANYYRLIKLLPNLKICDEWNFEVGIGPVSGDVQIKVLDRAPYTSTLQIRQLEASNQWANVPVLTICLYHDVNMAEVIAWENHRRLRPRYEYPNPDMYHSDEKAQLNKFLREWLTLCQCHGRSAIDISDLGLGS